MIWLLYCQFYQANSGCPIESKLQKNESGIDSLSASSNSVSYCCPNDMFTPHVSTLSLTILCPEFFWIADPELEKTELNFVQGSTCEILFHQVQLRSTSFRRKSQSHLFTNKINYDFLWSTSDFYLCFYVLLLYAYTFVFSMRLKILSYPSVSSRHLNLYW